MNIKTNKTRVNPRKRLAMVYTDQELQQLNQRASELNATRQRKLGSIESSTQQLNALLTRYSQQYGVTLTVESLQAEYDKVYTELQQEAKKLSDTITSIDNGDYKQEGEAYKPLQDPVVDFSQTNNTPVKEQKQDVSNEQPKTNVVPQQNQQNNVNPVQQNNPVPPVNNSTPQFGQSTPPVVPNNNVNNNASTNTTPKLGVFNQVSTPTTPQFGQTAPQQAVNTQNTTQQNTSQHAVTPPQNNNTGGTKPKVNPAMLAHMTQAQQQLPTGAGFDELRQLQEDSTKKPETKVVTPPADNNKSSFGIPFQQNNNNTAPQNAPQFGPPQYGQPQFAQTTNTIAVPSQNNTNEDVSDTPISPAGWGTQDVTDPNFDANAKFNQILGK